MSQDLAKLKNREALLQVQNSNRMMPILKGSNHRPSNSVNIIPQVKTEKVKGLNQAF